MYDGARMASLGDVVVVTVNHRLAAFGYLNLAGLGAPAEFANAGNCGVMDMVASLRWVRDNIERFGGDPSRVMVFGQSGGGSKTSTLLATPSAKGLFQRAAVQSGSTLRQATGEEATVEAEKLIKALGLSKKNLAAIQQIPWTKLLEAQVASGGQLPPGGRRQNLAESSLRSGGAEGVGRRAGDHLHHPARRGAQAHQLRPRRSPGWRGSSAGGSAPRPPTSWPLYRQEKPRQSPYLTQAEAFTDATRGNSQIQALRKAAQGKARDLHVRLGLGHAGL